MVLSVSPGAKVREPERSVKSLLPAMAKSLAQ